MVMEWINFILTIILVASIFLMKSYFSTFSSKTGEIDAQLKNLNQLSKITRELEHIKEDLKKPTIEYQIRTAELYKKTYHELDLVYRSFLVLSSFLKELSIEYNVKLEQCWNEEERDQIQRFLVWQFRSLELKIINTKKQLKESSIWLPKELVKVINQHIIHINEEYLKITSTFENNNDYVFMENEIKVYLPSLSKIVINSENNIMGEIDKYELYSISKLINNL